MNLKETFRRAREAAYGDYGRPPPLFKGRRPETRDDDEEPCEDVAEKEAAPPPPYLPGDDSAREADTRKIAELKQLNTELDARVVELLREVQIRDTALSENEELIKASQASLAETLQPFFDVLRLPGVRNWLANKFHPDKNEKADAKMKPFFKASIQSINAVYAMIDRDAKQRGVREAPED